MDRRDFTHNIVTAAIASFLLSATTHTFAQTATDQTDKLEKCYGIAKKKMNDCQTKTDSCAGSAKKDNQKDAFILLPKGACDKIVGGRYHETDF